MRPILGPKALIAGLSKHGQCGIVVKCWALGFNPPLSLCSCETSGVPQVLYMQNGDKITYMISCYKD